MENSEKRIAWIDVETNGRSPRDGSKLLQVAMIITDADYNEVHDGIEVKIKYSKEEALDLFVNADSNVQDMHSKTDLWNKIVTDGVPLVEAEEMILKELKKYGQEDWTPLGGNTLSLDRDFLLESMPKVNDYLYYQNLDMSSVARFFKNTLPMIEKFQKNYTHDALDDIRESIAEARYYSTLVKSILFTNFV